MATRFLTLAFAILAAAQSPVSSLIQALIAEFNVTEPIAYKLNPVTPQLLKTFIEPITVQIQRNSYVYRQGSELRLDGKQWTASGANVYIPFFRYLFTDNI